MVMIKLGPKYQKIKKIVVQYLTDKKLYDSVDTSLIDELMYNYYLADQAKESIKKTGIVVNLRKSDLEPYWQQSPAISVYNQAVNGINTISSKLSLTPADRKKLKLFVETKTDFEENYGDD